MSALKRGQNDGFIVGRGWRRWEDRVWDIEDPRKSVWPQGGSAQDKEGGDPYPADSPSCGTGCLCTSKQGRERASVCKYRRLRTACLAFYSERSRSSPGNVFSRQRWKHGLFIVNNAPPRPPHSPNHDALVRCLSGVGLQCWGAERLANLKRVPGWDPPGGAPGIATRAGGQGQREPSRRACRPARQPEAPFASSTPGAQAFPGGPACCRPLPHGPPENYSDLVSGLASETAAEL